MPSKPTRTFAPGTIIAGKYQVERQIGKGGMGCIVSARHLQLEETVALKFLLAPDDRAEEFQQRFLREARVTAKLRGEHVARTLDFGVTEEGDPYIVMEYLQGITLRQLMRESGPLPLDVAVHYALQVCEGLAEAHRSDVVHRDLKPANLFLTKNLDGGDLLKILDFGVSKLRNFAAAQADLTEVGTLIGSPRYMAIEQLVRAGDVDERADVWSLGAIVYEMLAGRPPFDGKNTAAVCMTIMRGWDPPPIRERREDVPEALERAVLRCLSRDLDERTPNVAVLARELAVTSGIEGAPAVAKAVEDVLTLQPLSLTSSGQLRSFGQSGSCPSASARPPIGGDDETLAEASRVSTSGLISDPPPSRAASRKRLAAVVGLALAVVAVASVIGFGRQHADANGAPAAANAGGDRAEPPAVGSTAPSVSSEAVVEAMVPDASATEAGDACADAQDASPPPRGKRWHAPRWSPPPKEAPKTPEPAPPEEPDPFSSRY